MRLRRERNSTDIAFIFFVLLFTSHRSPLSERLEQANISTSLLKKSALDARVYSVLKGPEAII